MSRIVLHGATMGTNFGDFLFAKLFYDKVCNLNKDGETFFFESKYAMSDFFKTRLNYEYKYSIRKLLQADALIYISGGYFGERNPGLKESILRFLRYMLVGCFFVLMKKPIGIIGVGVGPLSNSFLRFICKKIFNHASLIMVRDVQSKEYLEKYGVKNNIIVTSDSAQVLSSNDFVMDDIHIKKWVVGEFLKEKYIFVHINPTYARNIDIINKIIKPLNIFFKQHTEYGVIIGCDQYSKSKDQLELVKDLLENNNILLFSYDDPLSLCYILNRVDLIVTTKLHVGIVGATFSKSVISISGHSEKIIRYYKQINEMNRAIELSKCNDSQVIDMLNKFHDVPIKLDKKILKLAQLNFTKLADFVRELNS